MTSDPFAEAAAILRGAKSVIALTGAGVSVESGIPDFRSPGGLWDRYPPDEYATIDAFYRDPEKLWQLWREVGRRFLEVQPNPGHHALAALERMGGLRAIITQNIDNLHQAAGSLRVIEYHGNARRMLCLKCHRRAPLDLSGEGHGAPRCACGGVMKPDVVLFGEIIPKHALMESDALAMNCDAIIVAGTSATVYPAAGIPHTVKGNGALVIECNVEATEFTHTITDVFLRGRSGECLPRLLAQFSQT